MDKLERAQIRTEYCKENGYVWIKPENTEMDGYIKYLEDKLIAQQEVKNTVDLASVSQERELLIAYESKMHCTGSKKERLEQSTRKADAYLSNL